MSAFPRRQKALAIAIDNVQNQTIDKQAKDAKRWDTAANAKARGENPLSAATRQSPSACPSL
nr:hypothetical protein [Chromobacterium sp. ASV5]